MSFVPKLGASHWRHYVRQRSCAVCSHRIVRVGEVEGGRGRKRVGRCGAIEGEPKCKQARNVDAMCGNDGRLFVAIESP